MHVDVAKCHACHANSRGDQRTQARHQSQPSAISAMPATQNACRCRQVARLPTRDKMFVSKLCVDKLCVDKLCVSKLCMDKLCVCVSKLCVSKLCVCVDKLCVNKLCVSKLCVDKLGVSKLCVDKLCVNKLCVSKLCWTSCVWQVVCVKAVCEQVVCGQVVCVWTICTDVKLPSVCFVFWSTIFVPYMQGGSESHSIHCPTKTVVWDCDIGTDHPDVPAIFQFIVNGNRLSQAPACRSKPFHFLHCCRNLEF